MTAEFDFRCPLCFTDPSMPLDCHECGPRAHAVCPPCAGEYCGGREYQSTRRIYLRECPAPLLVARALMGKQS